MTSADFHDDELVETLRQSLQAAASDVVPRGDGLSTIQSRIADRRRRYAWLRPALAGATAAVAIAVVASGPTNLAPKHELSDTAANSLAEQQRRGAAAPSRTAAEPTPSAASPTTNSQSAQPSGSGSTTPSAAENPNAAGNSLPDVTTIWPYGSREDGNARVSADIAAGRFTDLTDPRRTALNFVKSYVGSDSGLSASEPVQQATGVSVQIHRNTADSEKPLVSTVFLVKLRDTNSSPYVVASASQSTMDNNATALTIAASKNSDNKILQASGNFRQPSKEQLPNAVHVEVRDVDDLQILASADASLQSTAMANQWNWNAALSIRGSASGNSTIAAWTKGANGQLTNFAATHG